MRSAGNRLSLPILVALCFWVAGGGTEYARPSTASPTLAVAPELFAELLQIGRCTRTAKRGCERASVQARIPAPPAPPRRCRRRFLLPPIRAPGA